MQKDRPNILIFMTDQMQEQVTLPEHPCKTPNIEKLAREGVRFPYAYPPMAHCCPSRASFFTGLYPSQHGIHNNVLNEQAIGKALKPGVETFSEKLKNDGYNMYFSGKWHVSSDEMPSDRGWEELYTTSNTKQYHGFRRKQWMETDYNKTVTERGNGEIVRPGWGTYRLYGTAKQNQENDSDRITINKAIEKIHSLDSGSEPWCMFVGVTGPHDPFIIPEKYSKLYNPDDIDLPPNYHDDLNDKPGIYRRMRRRFNQLSEREVKESIAHYWGFCTMMDDMFGEVMGALECSGQKDNTLVIFLSDHGEHCGAHGLYAKGISTFEEGYRIPCIMSWTGVIENQGRTVNEFVAIMDIAPTIIEAAGADNLNKCAGMSLLPFLRNEAVENWRNCIFTQCNGVEVYYTNRMVRTKKYKFVYHPTDIDELYDLEKDPYELVNLADNPDMSDVKKGMYSLMWKCANESEDTIFNPYITVASADFGPAIMNT